MTSPSMNEKTIASIAIAGIVLAFTGVITSYGTNFLSSEDNSATTTAYMVGHVIAEVKDSDGRITGYSQSDNDFLDEGEECVAKMIFNGTSRTQTVLCNEAIGSQGFNVIGLVNTSNTCATVLETFEVATAGCGAIDANDGLINDTLTGFKRERADSVVIAVGGADIQATLTKVFTLDSRAGIQTVQRSIITNTTQTADAFHEIVAMQNFGSQAVVNPGGTLTITWQIDVDG